MTQSYKETTQRSQPRVLLICVVSVLSVLSVLSVFWLCGVFRKHVHGPKVMAFR